MRCPDVRVCRPVDRFPAQAAGMLNNFARWSASAGPPLAIIVRKVSMFRTVGLRDSLCEGQPDKSWAGCQSVTHGRVLDHPAQ